MLRNPETRRLTVSGQVQGVGFRPFVYRLASGLGLHGEVHNKSSGVYIIVQGPVGELDRFASELRRFAPGVIRELQTSTLEDAPRLRDFHIGASRRDRGVADVLLADQGICRDCRREFLDPGNRRCHYPFVNCTACGPRFSVCRVLPYDRENTSWHAFPLCAQCRREYKSPRDRRFHAVGISCPDCGPTLYTAGGHRGPAAVAAAVDTLAGGGILAVKGSAGFQLMVDADNGEAVDRLRQRKRRHKPFAVLATDMDWIARHARVNAVERETLLSPCAPLVLLQSDCAVGRTVAPGTGMLAVMLPNSGIQMVLVQALSRPLVATSGNISESPLLLDNGQALATLAGIADEFLLHDLELTQGLDDSIIRVMANTPVALRLGRGLAPQIHHFAGGVHTMGCGAHLKANISLHGNGRLVSGPYVGNLGNPEARQRYRQQKARLPAFFQIANAREITDLHPDYGSTIEADYRAATVPHHVAHAMAAWFERQPEPPFLVLAWDGTGLGPDNTVWGGECLLFDESFHWQRVGSVTPFPLPAGENIARHPGRIARILNGRETPLRFVPCSSMGRLIEGLAAAAGLRSHNDYEAQAAMEWEALAWQGRRGTAMEFGLVDCNLHWPPLLSVIQDPASTPEDKALGFHQALAKAAVRQCRPFGIKTVLLSGGVFQNRLLLELVVHELEQAGMNPLFHRAIPPNDGGISLGQCVAAALAVTARPGTQL